MIIKNKSSRLDDVTALWYVQQVVEQGKVSTKGKNYAYSTLFTKTRVVVSVVPNKLSDSFIVCDYKIKKHE
jgi:hypothetical protein